jgi:hypothetical protein
MEAKVQKIEGPGGLRWTDGENNEGLRRVAALETSENGL